MQEDFETAKRRRGSGPWRLPSGFLARYKPQILISALVLLVLAGGAYYSSRVSESAPKVVYSTSLEEAKTKAQTPLQVNINTADAKELDELPGVGPSTAEKIVEHRRHRGKFKSVNELSLVHNYKSEKEIRFSAFLAEETSEVELALV